MDDRRVNVSRVDRSVVSIGMAGALTNNVGQPDRTGDPDYDDRGGGIAALLSQFTLFLRQLRPEGSVEIEAQIQTVRAQLSSTQPNWAIIRESLRVTRNLLEGVQGNPAGAQILNVLDELIAAR